MVVVNGYIFSLVIYGGICGWYVIFFGFFDGIIRLELFEKEWIYV